MVLPVHLRLSAVVAIVDCPDQGQFIDSRSLKQAALQSIWLFQESLSRWVSSYNWDLHNLFLSKSKHLSEGFSTYPDVNKLAQGIESCESLAMRFGRFGHMGMGVSWYLPVDTHSLLDPKNTFVLRTEELDSDFHGFVNQFCNRYDIQERGIGGSTQMLSRTKHNFQSSYPKDTFQKLDYSRVEVIDAMNRYLDNDIKAHSSLVKAFSFKESDIV